MENEFYRVRPGDTLSKIAQTHGVDVNDLASINHIRDSNFIHVGRKLKIPSKVHTSRPEESYHSEIWLYFADAIGKPIVNLKTRIVTALGEYKFSTDKFGLLPPFRTENKDDRSHIFVERLGRGEKKVAQISSPPGTHQYTLRSPKQKVDVTMRKHDGMPDQNTREPLPIESGETKNNRDLAGNPIVNVGVECPNKDNLRLGANDRYREYVVRASERAGIQPQAVAAIMNAEAAKLSVLIEKPVYSKGRPLKNADGSSKMKKQRISTGEWDPKSASPRSSARGMTQFLDGTWIAMATTKGSFLYEKAKERGWTTTNAKGDGVSFNFSDGSSRPFTAKNLMRHVKGRANADDANVQALLDLRYDAECAIHTAVDYAGQNMSAIAKKGYPLDALNSSEKARVMYASHHLGPGDVVGFIEEGFSEEHAKELLIAQVGSARAQILAIAQNDRYVAAHRHWLNDFIEGKITPKAFACNAESVPAGRSLLEITADLKMGKK